MNKILAITTATIMAAFLTAPVQAEEVEVDCIADPTNEVCIMPLDQETPTPNETTPAPTDYPDLPKDNCSPDLTTNCIPEYIEDETDEIIEEGTDDEEEGESAMWPVYVSFGALGAAVVIFIALNLFGGKKK